MFGCVIKIYLGVVRGSHGTSRILGDISKYLDANMNVSTLALKNCACVDQVQILNNEWETKDTTLWQVMVQMGRLGCKAFNVSMMGFEENECILRRQSHWTTHFN